MPEFIANLPADQMVYGGFKVVGVDDRGNTVSRRPKFIFVKYFPEAVPGMKRGRASGHKGEIKQIMNAHIDIEVGMRRTKCACVCSNPHMFMQIETPDELTEEVIIMKLRASGGAHAPTGYEFHDYSK